MRVLGIILFEFLLGYILQSFTLVFGLYVFNKRKIELKKYIITSMIMAVVVYIMRLLPISFGVHTVLDFVAAFLLGILYLKMSVLSTVKAALIMFSLILVLDLVDFLVLSSIIGHVKFVELTNDELMRSILALPTAVLFTLIIILSYYFIVYKKSKKLLEIKGA